MTKNPVVLVHGAGGSSGSWKKLVPLLEASGRRAFALDYGRYGHGRLVGRGVGGVGDAYRCADELAAYVDYVLKETGAAKVDLVGHSFGGLVAQYYLKRLGGNAKVDRVVGLGPTFHGTTFNGLLRVPLFRELGARAFAENIPQQAASSSFVQELYCDGDAAPGVTYSVISPRIDLFTTPVRSQRMPGSPWVRAPGLSEHASMTFHTGALRLVREALETGVMTKPGPRSFDPDAVGNAETDAWAAYYRREWRPFLSAAIAMVREGFGMGRVRTLQGAYLVLRANQVWAPYPDNDPDAARSFMRRFYSLVAADSGLDLDPAHAARLEVEWWRLHREHQYGVLGEDGPLVESLVDLYSYVYAAKPDDVREAARQRVLAMEHSDAWVKAGCDLADPLLQQERDALLASYRALRVAVAT